MTRANVIGLLLGIALALPGTASVSRGSGHEPVAHIPADGAADLQGGIVEGVAGRVLSAGGAPVPDVLVQPRPLDPATPPIPEIAILSGSDGRYEWRLFPGSYAITASAPGYGEVTHAAVVEAGRVTVVDFSLERAP